VREIILYSFPSEAISILSVGIKYSVFSDIVIAVDKIKCI